jgi:hypothetical protein
MIDEMSDETLVNHISIRYARTIFDKKHPIDLEDNRGGWFGHNYSSFSVSSDD